jgi:hypothetical protein
MAAVAYSRPTHPAITNRKPGFLRPARGKEEKRFLPSVEPQQCHGEQEIQDSSLSRGLELISDLEDSKLQYQVGKEGYIC